MSTTPNPPASSTPSASNASSHASQLSDGVNAALSFADSTTTQSVQSLKLVHQARLSQLSRTAATLKAHYGAGDPRTQAAQAAVTAATSTAARISMVSQQFATPAPQVSATGWVVHGRVFDAQLQSAPNLTVFLVDGQKNYQEQYGFSYTDSTGYFLINYAGTADQPAATAGQARTAPQLFVEVANQSGQPVYLSTAPFQPALGSVTYQNITLLAGEPPLGNPPPAIRSVAVPPQARKK